MGSRSSYTQQRRQQRSIDRRWSTMIYRYLGIWANSETLSEYSDIFFCLFSDKHFSSLSPNMAGFGWNSPKIFGVAIEFRTKIFFSNKTFSDFLSELSSWNDKFASVCVRPWHLRMRYTYQIHEDKWWQSLKNYRAGKRQYKSIRHNHQEQANTNIKIKTSLMAYGDGEYICDVCLFRCSMDGY